MSKHALTARHPLRSSGLALALAAALTTAAAPVAQAQVNLPALGDSVSEDLDINAENRLGERIMMEIRQDPDYLDDPVLSDYIRSIWQPLVQAAQDAGYLEPDRARLFAWETFEVREKSINAFALPGGYVGVHLGLIAMTGSSDELASVLGHELTHVVQRHIARGMAAQKRQSMLSMAGLVLGLIAATRSRNVDAANAVVMGSQAAAIQGQLNFSREMEREADHIGLQLMERAGFASSGMAQMFQKLEASSRLNDSNQYPYLRSHPLTIERISDARLRMNDSPSHRPPSVAVHALMQARARVLMDTNEMSLRRLQQQAQPGSPSVDTARLGTLYAGALASMKLRDFDQARRIADSALALAREHFADETMALRDLHLLDLEIEVAMNRPDQPLPTALAPLAKDDSRPVLLARADAALAWQRAGDAAAPAEVRRSMEALQTWVTEHKNDTLAWQALSSCAEAQGLRLRSLRAAAEVAATQGDTVGAVDRFRTAQRLAKQDPNADYVETAIIQSRLREMEAEKRREQDEDKN